MRKTSQHDKIEKYIAEHGSITPMQAFADLRITKLATRISEMRRRGFECKIEIINAVDSDGQRVRFAKYSKAEG